MHRAGEKLIPVAKSNDKRQTTAMLAASITGKYLTPQLIYVQRNCHPAVTFPEGWDIWHSDNHWSNESTVPCYSTSKNQCFFHQLKMPSFEAQEVAQWSRFVWLFSRADNWCCGVTTTHKLYHFYANSTELHRQTSTNGWVHQQANQAWNEE